MQVAMKMSLNVPATVHQPVYPCVKLPVASLRISLCQHQCLPHHLNRHQQSCLALRSTSHQHNSGIINYRSKPQAPRHQLRLLSFRCHSP